MKTLSKKKGVPPERWTKQTLIDESRILHAAAVISDGRLAQTKQMRRLSQLLVWAAANLKELR